MVSVKNLEKYYNDFYAVKKINFEIKSGSISGFLGRNGAGKTTTMNILCGIINYNSGEILFNGKDFRTSKREILRDIGYVPQNPAFYDFMTAVEYLNFCSKILNRPNQEINLMKRIDEVLEIVGLESVKNKKIGAYSGGMRQRFAIATALLSKPELLVLDEPTSSLDPQGRHDILTFISELKERGITVFLSTHILNDVERVCDRVSIIENGEIILEDDINSLKSKFIKPIYDIEIADNSQHVQQIINNTNLLENISEKFEFNSDILSVYLKNDTGTNELIKRIVNNNLKIISFNQRKLNLEDIFMRLVNEHSNI